MVLHFAWIVFVLLGFALTIRAFWKPEFLDRWIFRTIHLAGIAFVAALEIFGKYCPLTIWENALRAHYDPELAYPGSFVIHYIAKLVYPEIDPLALIIPTVIIAAFTLVMFIARPPAKFKRLRLFRSVN